LPSYLLVEGSLDAFFPRLGASVSQRRDG
jgi:hypothetical protein